MHANHTRWYWCVEVDYGKSWRHILWTSDVPGFVTYGYPLYAQAPLRSISYCYQYFGNWVNHLPFTRQIPQKKGKKIRQKFVWQEFKIEHAKFDFYVMLNKMNDAVLVATTIWETFVVCPFILQEDEVSRLEEELHISQRNKVGMDKILSNDTKIIRIWRENLRANNVEWRLSVRCHCNF